MTDTKEGIALVIGAGNGLSASLARALSQSGYEVVLSARNIDKLSSLAKEIEAVCVACDASDSKSVDALFEQIGRSGKPLSVMVYNPSARVHGAIAELNPEEVHRAIDITAFGAFLCGQAAVRLMLKQTHKKENGAKGTILFTGASAGVRGFPSSAPFAMGKFAQRGLAQSMSRELHPQGIHVVWINIDGGIYNAKYGSDKLPRMLDPQAIASTYLHLIQQHRSAWSEEISLRPWVEDF